MKPIIRLLAACALSLLFCLPVHAQWARAGMMEGRTYYVDLDTAQRDASLVTLWVLVDFSEPARTTRGRSYLSKKAKLEVDCSQRMMRQLQDTWHPEHMGAGEPVFFTDGSKVPAFPVQRESPGEILWKAACGRR
mgnify:CR=1 FL=1